MWRTSLAQRELNLLGVAWAGGKINSWEKDVISLISLGKHFCVLELQAEEMGRRENMDGFQRRWWGMEHEWVNQHQRACSEGLGKREERKQLSLWMPSLPHPCVAPGIHEQSSVSRGSDWVPPATKSLPETRLALGEGLTHGSCGEVLKVQESLIYKSIVHCQHGSLVFRKVGKEMRDHFFLFFFF